MSECYSFVVNGVPCSTEEEKPLLRYLRDELRLTSVKDGCSEGACGTCTILVDGKDVRSIPPYRRNGGHLLPELRLFPHHDGV